MRPVYLRLVTIRCRHRHKAVPYWLIILVSDPY
jgi:hypothetical protein